SHEDRQAVKSDIEGEIGALVDALNTNFGGRYVFSGQNTTTKPFGFSDEGKLEYNGNAENLPREVSPGVTVDLLSSGRNLMTVDGQDLGAFFTDVLQALDDDNIDVLGGDLLAKADVAFENTVHFRTEVGSTFNRLEAAKDRNETENLNLKN